MRVSMLSNGGITRVPVSDSIRVNGYSYPWQESCEAMAARLNGRTLN